MAGTEVVAQFLSTPFTIHAQRDEYFRKAHSNSTTASNFTTTQRVEDTTAKHKDFSTNFTLNQDDAPHPAGVEAEAKHFKELFSKLKFNYLEQETKEKYLRAILDDTPLVVETKDVTDIESKNSHLKAVLAERKKQVADQSQEIRTLAGDVCKKYVMLFEAASSAKAMSEEIAEMQKEIEELQNFEETDQNLPLAESLALLDRQTSELAYLDAQIAEYRASDTKLRSELHHLHDDLIKAQNDCEMAEAFAKESAKMRQAEDQAAPMAVTRQRLGSWYQLMTNIQMRLFGISAFQVLNGGRQIDITVTRPTQQYNLSFIGEPAKLEHVKCDVKSSKVDVLIADAIAANNPMLLLGKLATLS